MTKTGPNNAKTERPSSGQIGSIVFWQKHWIEVYTRYQPAPLPTAVWLPHWMWDIDNAVAGGGWCTVAFQLRNLPCRHLCLQLLAHNPSSRLSFGRFFDTLARSSAPNCVAWSQGNMGITAPTIPNFQVQLVVGRRSRCGCPILADAFFWWFQRAACVVKRSCRIPTSLFSPKLTGSHGLAFQRSLLLVPKESHSKAAVSQVPSCIDAQPKRGIKDNPWAAKGRFHCHGQARQLFLKFTLLSTLPSNFLRVPVKGKCPSRSHQSGSMLLDGRIKGDVVYITWTENAMGNGRVFQA